MFTRFINFLFPKQKTMLELAKEKILAQTHVFNSGDTVDIDLDKFFVVGKMRPNKASQRFDSFNVLFTHDDSTVAIKENEDVIFYFNKEGEVEEIRKTLKEVMAR